MTLIDEFTRECLAIRVARRINSFGVLETMADVMLMRGVPEHIRSDDGAEMTAKIVRNWLTQVAAKTLFIERADRDHVALLQYEKRDCRTNWASQRRDQTTLGPALRHLVDTAVSRPNVSFRR